MIIKRSIAIWTMMFLLLGMLPSPSSAASGSMRAVEYGGGLFVAVGDEGAVQTSPDGTTWTSRSSGTHMDLYAVAYGGGTYVATGMFGTILTSVDGIQWTARSSDTMEYLNDVVYSNGMFVAVGNKGMILTSADGIVWAKQSSGTTNHLGGIAYGNGTYVAAGASSTLLTSTDGTVWTARDAGISGNLTASVFANGKFVVVGYSGIALYSADGTTWTVADTGTYSMLHDVAYGNGKFMAVGADGLALTSADGIDWTSRSSGTMNTLYGIGYGNGIFVVAGASGTVFIPSEGSTWTTPDSGTMQNLSGVDYGDGRFAAVGAAGTIVTSDNGIDWTARSSGVDYGLLGIAYGNSRFVAVGYGGMVLNSADGVSWTNHQATSGTTNPIWSVVYGNGKFVAVGSGGVILSSFDGETWATRSAGTTELFYGVAFGGGMFVAVGENGTIVTSPDGDNWTPRVSGTDLFLGSVRYGNGIFLAGGSVGTVLVSEDGGVTWEERTPYLSEHIFGVAFANGRFFTVGNGGTIKSSANGVEWSDLSWATTKTLRSFAYGKGMYVAVGEGGTIVQYSVADLSGLSLSGGALAPAFDSSTGRYAVNVPNDVSSVTVTPTTMDEGATVTVNGKAVASGSASDAIALDVGGNTIKVDVTAADGVGTKTYTITVTRAAPAPIGNADLSGLALSGGAELAPAFASGTTSYVAGVSDAVSEMTVTPTTADAGAKVTVNGKPVASGAASDAIALQDGSNTITVVVTAADGKTTKTYTVTVVRSKSPLVNADLKGLALSGGAALNPAFAAGTTSYTASVPHAVDGIAVTPTLAQPAATMTVNGKKVLSGDASSLIPLNVGGNTITIVVTAADGVTTKTYTVTVTRAEPAPIGNANLSGLALSGGAALTPAFAAETTGYTSNVPNDVGSVTVTPTTADPVATVTVNGKTVASGAVSDAIALDLGGNAITVVVTAADGVTTKTYTITVTRAEPTPLPGSDANLSGLALSGGAELNPTFAAGTTSYTAGVSNAVSEMTVTPTTADAGATVTVNGKAVASGSASDAIALDVGGNAITVVVTAADGKTTKTYTVTVIRAKSPLFNADLKGLTLSGGAALHPTFAAETTSYTSSVPHAVDSIAVTPTLAQPAAAMTVNGKKVLSGDASSLIPLNVGGNTITIVVTAADGVTTKTYTVTVTRAEPAPIGNANLSGLALSGGAALTPSFTAETAGYTASVPNDVSSVTVTPTTAEAGATLTVNGKTVASGSASDAIALHVGGNAITIVVTAPDGVTTKTYTVTVTRAADSSSPSDSSSPAPSSSGPAPSNNNRISDNGELSLSAGQSGEVSLNDAIKVVVPAGASDRALRIAIEEVKDHQDLPTGQDILVSKIYEITKSMTENFDEPVALIFSFDPGSLRPDQKPVVFYFDEKKREWVEVGGEVTGNQIRVEVDHFTKFAVFAVDEKAGPETPGAPETPIEEITFRDTAGHWAEANIRQAVSAGFVAGYADGTFQPDRTVTRAEFAVMLTRALKLPPSGTAPTFADAEEFGDWSKEAIAQAAEAGIVKGYADGTFRPNAEVTRAEMAAMIAAAVNVSAPTGSATGFSDDELIPAWAKGAAAALRASGLLEGADDNRFDPLGQATRAEAVTLLLRILDSQA
ncbi:cadherin-like beta sandwich domain-containing protein [Paenibacillus flagellatus]|uniref:SLH domain-containing protein n=1 Tax=Paenibacillus flagellatus TaxID=2211139 RepID=A0A2V5KRL4_9BACL|nr:cadherin-like beta sandwich domain-containing protein [Paenibacillus flagellatus]PYI51516.1 hypothetical protein DLM86_24140 [Paenibacillus flagellatus]